MNALKVKIEDRTAKIGIMGLGYVGLPEAVALALAGFPVMGFDVDAVGVGRVSVGASYISDVPSEIVGFLNGSGCLSARAMASTPHPIEPLEVETHKHPATQPLNSHVLTL